MACCLGTGTIFPCRCCTVNKFDASTPGFSAPLRDFEAMKPVFQEAFPAFGRYLRENLKRKTNLLSKKDKETLECCQQMSCSPVFPAFMSLPSPYPGFKMANYFPADLQHSVGGIVRNYIFNTYVILCALCSMPIYRARYGEGPGLLDNALAAMPSILRGCMPYKHPHFHKGISIYCHASTDSQKKGKASKQGMGKLDSSYLKSLTLQIIICNII